MKLSSYFVGIWLLLLVVLFCSLGVWQYGRYQQKTVVNTAADNYVAFSKVVNDPEQWQWHNTQLRGRYITEPPVLLDNQSYNGVVGYQVFARFELSSGQQLLVNQGWVPVGAAVKMPPAAERVLEGIVAPYRRAGWRMGPPVVSPPDAPYLVVNYPDQNEWQRLYKAELLPFTLWLDASAPDGYVRDWALRAIPPEKHLAYAAQWFAMALAVVVIGIFLLVSVLRSHESEEG